LDDRERRDEEVWFGSPRRLRGGFVKRII